MKSIKELISGPEISNWSGSERTKSAVAEQIEQRYGRSELANYDPLRNMLTFRKWISLGFVPRKGERAIKSYVLMDLKDSKGNVKKVSRKINLFYYRQVSEIGSQKTI